MVGSDQSAFRYTVGSRIKEKIFVSGLGSRLFCALKLVCVRGRFHKSANHKKLFIYTNKFIFLDATSYGNFFEFYQLESAYGRALCLYNSVASCLPRNKNREFYVSLCKCKITCVFIYLQIYKYYRPCPRRMRRR